MSREDLVRGLPRPALAAAPSPADVLGHGPLLGDDLFGLLGGDRGAVDARRQVQQRDQSALLILSLAAIARMTHLSA
jgi:hypothetical protein